MRVALIAGGLLALTLVGFLFVGGTAPYITVPPDPLWEVGGYTITNTLLAAWLTMVVLILVGIFAGPRMGLVPSGFSGFVEMIISGFFSICASVAEHRAFVAGEDYVFSACLGLGGQVWVGEAEERHEVVKVLVDVAVVYGELLPVVPFGVPPLCLG